LSIDVDAANPEPEQVSFRVCVTDVDDVLYSDASKASVYPLDTVRPIEGPTALSPGANGYLVAEVAVTLPTDVSDWARVIVRHVQGQYMNPPDPTETSCNTADLLWDSQVSHPTAFVSEEVLPTIYSPSSFSAYSHLFIVCVYDRAGNLYLDSGAPPFSQHQTDGD
jgi:hypothetical protein